MSIVDEAPASATNGDTPARTYLDFTRPYTLTQCLAFFIIRARKDFASYRVASEEDLHLRAVKPVRQKKRATRIACDPLKIIPAATYVPTHLRAQYHRPGEA